MTDKADKEDLRYEIPTHAFIALARRGMEKISLDQCFLKNCDNSDPKLLEPFKKEEFEDDQKHVKNNLNVLNYYHLRLTRILSP